MADTALGEVLEAHLARGRELSGRGASEEEYSAWRLAAMELVAGIPGTRSLLEVLREVELPERFQAAEAILAGARERVGVELVETGMEIALEEETCPLSFDLAAASSKTSFARAMQLLPHIASPGEEAELRQALLVLKAELEGLDPDWRVLRPALVRILEAEEALFLAILPHLAQRLRGLG